MPEEITEQQRKRSKRHRRKRNNISDKDRVSSAWDYALYAQAVDRAYKAKFAKKDPAAPINLPIAIGKP